MFIFFIHENILIKTYLKNYILVHFISFFMTLTPTEIISNTWKIHTPQITFQCSEIGYNLLDSEFIRILMHSKRQIISRYKLFSI